MNHEDTTTGQPDSGADSGLTSRPYWRRLVILPVMVLLNVAVSKLSPEQKEWAWYLSIALVVGVLVFGKGPFFKKVVVQEPRKKVSDDDQQPTR